MISEVICDRYLLAAPPGGAFLEIGCGTFAFSFETMAAAGFPCVAVEPLPSWAFLAACARSKTLTAEVCVSDRDGTIDLFLGQFQGCANGNLSSNASDWWGASAERVSVPCWTLATLIAHAGVTKMAAMKIDVEGTEAVIIRQFPTLSAALRPRVVVFEYGGGATKASGNCGWSETRWGNTLECITILRSLGYADFIAVDNAGRISGVDDISDASEYGNIVARLA